MPKSILFFVIFLPFLCFSQINEDFSDGDFSNNPTWTGDTDKFIVNAEGQLQLNAPSESATAYLSTTSTAIKDAAWECWVKLGFNPSTSNYARFYLVSNNSDLSGNLNGYFLRIGYGSGTNKELSLYKQSGRSFEKIIGSENILGGLDPIEVKIKVTRSAEGEWQLFSQLASESAYSEIGEETTENSYTLSHYSGFLCNYTSTRRNLFYFDNIHVSGEKYLDNLPPVLSNINAIGDKLTLTFSEPIKDIASSNFQVVDFGSPITLSLSEDKTIAELTFSSEFKKSRTYLLRANDVFDLEGNKMLENEFQFYIPELPVQGDIVINEVMFENPEDAEEYIELYNASKKILDLSGLRITTRKTDGSLNAGSSIPSGTIIFPNDYLALCKTPEIVKDYFSLPSEAKLATMTFSALNNTSATLLLTNDSREVIYDQFTYSSSWHNSTLSSVKGVSIEKIHPLLLAEDSQSWQSASEDSNFGTPGYKNSAFSEIDLILPRLYFLEMTNDKSGLLLKFSKKMNFASAEYSVSDIGTPENILIIDDYSVQLTFSSAFEEQVVYVLYVSINDMSALSLPINEYKFGVAEEPKVGDVVINEVLFESPDAVDEYVEIYNRTDKILDVSGLKITTLKSDGSQNAGSLIPAKSFIYPHDYLAFCKRPNVVREYYSCPESAQFVSMNMLSLNNSEGSLILLNPSANEIYDQLTYSSKWHHPLIATTKGVALERINPDLPTQNADSWHSASSQTNYGTPGYKNSQYMEIALPSVDEKIVWTEPEIFSPDNDGNDDVCALHYRMEELGYAANIVVFNASGESVYHLASNALLQSEGFFLWDGRTDKGKNVNPGIYVIFFQAFNSQNGKRVESKIPIAVSSR